MNFITGVMCYSDSMTVAESKLTSQGQISVPASIRKKLGLAPGSVIEWVENEAGEITVKRSSKYSSEDIHKAVFKSPPEVVSVEKMNEVVKSRLAAKYAK